MSALDQARFIQIKAALPRIEREHQVRLVIAVESGSRAWGFASPDSDWDVRFVYAQPTDWFVALEPSRDVIEIPALGGDPLLDVSGWDMRKALNLALRGNAALREWLASPIVYAQAPEISTALRDILAMAPDLHATAQHYASLARRTHEAYLTGPEVSLKKYLYALRPALCLRWLRDRAELPPMDLPSLRAVATSPGEPEMLDELLARKAVASELGVGPRLAIADALIRQMLDWASAHSPPPPPPAQRDRAKQAALDLLRRSANWAAAD
jgi:uncharacterized protein